MKDRILAGFFPLLMALFFAYSAWHTYTQDQCIGFEKDHVSVHQCYGSEYYTDIAIALVGFVSFMFQVLYIFLAKDPPNTGRYQSAYGDGPFKNNSLVFMMLLVVIAFVVWIAYMTLKKDGLL